MRTFKKTTYSIRYLPACADYQGNQYPDRWEVTSTDYHPSFLPNGRLTQSCAQEFMSRDEAIAFHDMLVERQLDSEIAAEIRQEERSGAYCL